MSGQWRFDLPIIVFDFPRETEYLYTIPERTYDSILMFPLITLFGQLAYKVLLIFKNPQCKERVSGSVVGILWCFLLNGPVIAQMPTELHEMRCMQTLTVGNSSYT